MVDDKYFLIPRTHRRQLGPLFGHGSRLFPAIPSQSTLTALFVPVVFEGLALDRITQCGVPISNSEERNRAKLNQVAGGPDSSITVEEISARLRGLRLRVNVQDEKHTPVAAKRSREKQLASTLQLTGRKRAPIP